MKARVFVSNQKFTPDGSGGGTLEWDERVVRNGFRDVIRHRRIRKEANLAEVAREAA